MPQDKSEWINEFKKFTKYETARLIGARALQIGMGAPILIKLSEKDLEEVKYNPIEIAKREIEKNAVPITVRRNLPKAALKRVG